MVAVNRLTGHSPASSRSTRCRPIRRLDQRAGEDQRPAQAGAAAARRARAHRGEEPLAAAGLRRLTRATLPRPRDAADAPGRVTPEIKSDSVGLVVTSPPFLDVVDYAADNWLRGWFCGIDTSAVQITMHRKVEEWQARWRGRSASCGALRPGGHVAFEVGEVRGGKVKLEEVVIPSGVAAGLEPLLVVINAQQFTKAANCWGVRTTRRGRTRTDWSSEKDDLLVFVTAEVPGSPESNVSNTVSSLVIDSRSCSLRVMLASFRAPPSRVTVVYALTNAPKPALST